jgi:curved DNA-binding protein CbpA
MSATLAGKFQDHYLVLGVSPSADSETIQKAYAALAAKYHPNNPATGDREKFAAVNAAYEVLADPAARQIFDSLRSGPQKEAPPNFSGAEFFQALAEETLRRQCILCLLYDRRRQKPATPSLSMRQLESLMTASSDQIQFSVWYLKQKSWIASDDKSNLYITVQGMEYLETNLPKAGDILPLLAPSAASVATAPNPSSPPELSPLQ